MGYSPELIGLAISLIFTMEVYRGVEGSERGALDLLLNYDRKLANWYREQKDYTSQHGIPPIRNQLFEPVPGYVRIGSLDGRKDSEDESKPECDEWEWYQKDRKDPTSECADPGGIPEEGDDSDLQLSLNESTTEESSTDKELLDIKQDDDTRDRPGTEEVGEDKGYPEDEKGNEDVAGHTERDIGEEEATGGPGDGEESDDPLMIPVSLERESEAEYDEAATYLLSPKEERSPGTTTTEVLIIKNRVLRKVVNRTRDKPTS